jgi:hypothetical protein
MCAAGAPNDRELLQRELQRVQAQLHEANRKAAEYEVQIR